MDKLATLRQLKTALLRAKKEMGQAAKTAQARSDRITVNGVGQDEAGDIALAVGGRNYIKNSLIDIAFTNTDNPGSCILEKGKITVILPVFNAYGWMDKFFVVPLSELEDGELYTASMEVMTRNLDPRDPLDFVMTFRNNNDPDYSSGTTSTSLENEKWIRCAVTVPYKKGLQKVTMGIKGNFRNATQQTPVIIEYRNLKIEHGSIATDWSPAPEDKQDALAGNAGQAVGFDEDGKATAVSVGGRNLLMNSLNPIIQYYDSASGDISKGISVPEWGTSHAIQVIGKGGRSNLCCYLTNPGSAMIPSGPYVMSAYVKNNGTKLIRVGRQRFVTVLPQESKRIMIPQDGYPSVQAFVQIQIYTENIGDEFDFVFWRPKVELGAVATDWSPAPEDKQDAVKYSTTDLAADSPLEEGQVYLVYE